MLQDHLPLYFKEVDRLQQRTYVVLDSYRHDNHETALVRIIRRSPAQYGEHVLYTLVCDCDFKPDVGWHRDVGGNVIHRPLHTQSPESCHHRKHSVRTRTDELRRAFRREKQRFAATSPASISYISNIQKGLLWIKAVLEKGELVGSAKQAFPHGNYVSLKEAAEILDILNEKDVCAIANIMNRVNELRLHGNYIFVPTHELKLEQDTEA